MTSRERLWAVLNGQEPDRVPIWMLYPRVRVPYYVDVHHLSSYAKVMPHVWEKTDWFDRRSIPAPFLYTAAAQLETQVEVKGSRTITQQILHTPLGDLTSEHWEDAENAAGATVEFFCKDIADLEKALAIPYEPAQPDVAEFHQAAKSLGDVGLMMVNLQMPVGVAYDLLGPENFAIYTLTAREALVQFMQKMFARQYTFLKKMLAAGAGPVFFTTDTEYVAPPMCSPETFDVLVTPFEAPLFELIHQSGDKIIVHHHGRINAILERLAAMGADGIHPIEEPPIGDCPLAEAKRRVGDRLCLVGSVQYDDFERLEPDAIEELVKRQIRDAAPGGGMILAPTAGPYAAHLTGRQQENTLRFIEAGLKWGRYPLH